MIQENLQTVINDLAEITTILKCCYSYVDNNQIRIIFMIDNNQAT